MRVPVLDIRLTVWLPADTRARTGDNIHTAQHIARECGILYDMGPNHPEHVAMEGPVFREMLKVCVVAVQMGEGRRRACVRILLSGGPAVVCRRRYVCSCAYEA